MELPLEWLLQGEPWIVFLTRHWLMDKPETDLETVAARQAMLESPPVKALLHQLADWPQTPINSHKSAGHPLHLLAFLAEIGVQAGDPGIDQVIDRVLAHRDPNGPFQVIMNIPVAYGGSGLEQPAWALCDSPLVTACLAQMGLAHDPCLQPAVSHLSGLVRDNGWPCAVSPELGKWRGPGRKDDPCPYATLLMLRLLAHLSGWSDTPQARAGVKALLDLWQTSLESHPYQFYMGSDFRKLKAPLVWYDILHVLDVLTRFPWIHQDERLREMAAIVESRADEHGRFTPESIYKAWAGWDFGQKKQPSRYLTLLAWRAIRRMNAPLMVR